MDIVSNLRTWNKDYPWSEGGDEWSGPWGGTHWLWYTSLLPRISRFVPTQRILEIAPGYGRCTQYLKDLCRALVLVDLADTCIEACKKRFADSGNIEYHVNDGKTLPVPDQSVDFVFSWDSLVHAEEDAVRPYVRELKRVLRNGGFAFIHHSNLGQFPGLVDDVHFRAASVSARSFRDYCDEARLWCVLQELKPQGEKLIDCVSLVANREPKQKTKIREAPWWRDEIAQAKRWRDLYDIGDIEPA